MTRSPRFARRVFLIAGIYGLIVMLPQYFLEDRLNRDFPPPITHPEHFYGFIGVTVAWQVAFLIIASDVVRYRPLMIAAIIEKFTFGPAVLALYYAGRTNSTVLAFGILDMLIGVLFVLSYLTTRNAAHSADTTSN